MLLTCSLGTTGWSSLGCSSACVQAYFFPASYVILPVTATGNFKEEMFFLLAGK